MTIQFAILGLLSWQPLSGYDLKKMFSNSDIFYWSGNNNQIYTTLVQLHKRGWVTPEIQYQENSPTKKVYSITSTGREALKNWVLSTPELPEMRNTFLIQLAWADRLEVEELDTLLDKYQEEVSIHLTMLREKNRRGKAAPNRTGREAYLWAEISENHVSHFENELSWVRKLRLGLNEKNFSIGR